MKLYTNIVMSPDAQAGNSEAGAGGRQLFLAAVHGGRGDVQLVEVGAAERSWCSLQRWDGDFLEKFAGARVYFDHLKHNYSIVSILIDIDKIYKFIYTRNFTIVQFNRFIIDYFINSWLRIELCSSLSCLL